MNYLIRLFFRPPHIEIPSPLKMIPGLANMIGNLVQAIYLRGWYDGFLAGAILALLLTQSRRPKN